MKAGFRRFQEKYYQSGKEISLSSGQSPKTLIIACSDSRVDPAILADANPGEIFVVRNVANLVPPFESNQGFHGVSAAIEFAVVNLEVDLIVILGHRQCGGIRSLFEPKVVRKDGFVTQWMKIAAGAKNSILSSMPGADIDSLCRACEQESIFASLENLGTFPFVKEAKDMRGMRVLGLYFDLEAGVLLEMDEATRKAAPVSL